MKGSSEVAAAGGGGQGLDQQGQRPNRGRPTSEAKIQHQIQICRGMGNAGSPSLQGQGSLYSMVLPLEQAMCLNLQINGGHP